MANTNTAATTTNNNTVVDHLIAITNHLMRLHWELTREQAYLEAIIAYRRYGMRAEDLPPLR